MKTLVKASTRKNKDGSSEKIITGKAVITGVGANIRENSNGKQFRNFNAELQMQEDDAGNIGTLNVMGQIYLSFETVAFAEGGLGVGEELEIYCSQENFTNKEFRQFSVAGRPIDTIDEDTHANLLADLGI